MCQNQEENEYVGYFFIDSLSRQTSKYFLFRYVIYSNPKDQIGFFYYYFSFSVLLYSKDYFVT